MRQVFGRWVAVAALSLALAGCLPQTENSIANPAAPADERLVGTWVSQHDDYVEVLDISRPEGGDGGLLSVVLVQFASKGDDPEPNTTRFDVRFTEIGGQTWFEAEPRGPDAFPEPDHGYKRFFGRYEVSGDRLVIRFPDEKAMIEAIAGGRLDGEAGDAGDWDNIRLTGPAAQIRAFLASGVSFEDGVRASYARFVAPR